MTILWQLGYTQSRLLKWMGLFIQRGTVQKPVLAYYSASPSELQTYTCCLQNTAGTTRNTITAQFLSVTTALPFCAVLTRGQDLLFCVPACCHFAGRSAARKKLTETQYHSLPHAESRDCLTVGLAEQGLAEHSCSSLPVPFYRCRGADWFMKESGARFWIPIFFRLCHFPNALLWKETHSWPHIRSSIVQKDYCRATYWGALLTAPKEGCQRKWHGIAYILHGTDAWTGTRKRDSNSERMWKSVLTTRDQLTGGIMYWYKARSPNSHQTKISAGTRRQERLCWRTRHHVPLRSHRGRSCCII